MKRPQKTCTCDCTHRSVTHKKKNNLISKIFSKKNFKMKKIGPTAIAGGIAAYLGYKYLDDKLLLSNVRFLFFVFSSFLRDDVEKKKNRTSRFP